jgi:hypothetical protein
MGIYRQPAKWESIPSERMSKTTATISAAAAANAMPSLFSKFMALEPVPCAMATLRQLLSPRGHLSSLPPARGLLGSPYVQFWKTENSGRLDSSRGWGDRRAIPGLVDASNLRTVNAVKILLGCQ